MQRAAGGSRTRHRAAVAIVAGAAFVVLLVAVAVRWSALVDLDRRVARRVDRFDGHHPDLVHVARFVSLVGQPLVWTVLAGVLVAVELLRRRVRAALLVFGALGAELVLGHALKVAVDRPRPTVPHPVSSAGGASFPSSHALGSASVLCVAVLVAGPVLARAARRWAAGAAALMSLTIGLSRVVLDVHYPSDVVGGWLLGVAIAFALAAAGPAD